MEKAKAWLSRTGNTYSGSLWLKWVANRSRLGLLNFWKIEFAINWSNAHSVLTTLSILDNLPAKTLNLPGIWQILTTIWRFRHHRRIFHTCTHRSRECVPPCLLIYETTVVLSVDIMTQEWWIYFKVFISAKRMAIISNMLIWSQDWSSDQRPWKVRLIGSRWAPNPKWLASM